MPRTNEEKDIETELESESSEIDSEESSSKVRKMPLGVRLIQDKLNQALELKEMLTEEGKQNTPEFEANDRNIENLQQRMAQKLKDIERRATNTASGPIKASDQGGVTAPQQPPVQTTSSMANKNKPVVPPTQHEIDAKLMMDNYFLKVTWAMENALDTDVPIPHIEGVIKEAKALLQKIEVEYSDVKNAYEFLIAAKANTEIDLAEDGLAERKLREKKQEVTSTLSDEKKSPVVKDDSLKDVSGALVNVQSFLQKYLPAGLVKLVGLAPAVNELPSAPISQQKEVARKPTLLERAKTFLAGGAEQIERKLSSSAKMTAKLAPTVSPNHFAVFQARKTMSQQVIKIHDEITNIDEKIGADPSNQANKKLVEQRQAMLANLNEDQKEYLQNNMGYKASTIHLFVENPLTKARTNLYVVEGKKANITVGDVNINFDGQKLMVQTKTSDSNYEVGMIQQSRKDSGKEIKGPYVVIKNGGDSVQKYQVPSEYQQLEISHKAPLISKNEQQEMNRLIRSLESADRGIEAGKPIQIKLREAAVVKIEAMIEKNPILKDYLDQKYTLPSSVNTNSVKL
jgi:hypothetical protein